jgi:hypothetical protein
MSAGKGDSPRPVNGDAFRDNYDDIFRKKETTEPAHDPLQNMNNMKEIPIRKAMIAWNTKRESCFPRGGLPGQVGVCEHPDNGQLKHLSSWVGFQHWRTKAPVERYQLQLLIEAWHMMGRDGVSQKAIHDAFMVIPEYRSMISSDFKMLEQK